MIYAVSEYVTTKLLQLQKYIFNSEKWVSITVRG